MRFVLDVLTRLLPLVIIGFVGWFWFRKQHLHAMRMNLFAELMGNRYHVTGDGFTKALNATMVLFHDDAKVVRAIREFAEKAKKGEESEQYLLRVFRTICNNLGIPDESITDGDWKTAFNLKQAQPAPLVLKVTHAVGGPQPQVIVFAHADPMGSPVGLTFLDVPTTKFLIAELQAHLNQALAASAAK